MLRNIIEFFDAKLFNARQGFIAGHINGTKDYFWETYPAPFGFHRRGKSTYFLVNDEPILIFIMATVAIYLILSIIYSLLEAKMRSRPVSKSSFIPRKLTHQKEKLY